LYSNSTGSNNTALGDSALTFNNAGSNNVAIGTSALRVNTSSANTAVGHNTLSKTNALGNTAVGFEVLKENVTGTGNVGLGYGALAANIGGGDNTAIGNQAGNTITTSSNNIAIGYNAQVAVPANSNQIRLGNAAIVKADIQVAWTVTSDARFKKEIQPLGTTLPLIKALNPVSYKRINDTDSGRYENGLIAQELENTLNKLGMPTNGIISKDDKGYYSVRYNDFIPVLIKAVQEQQTEIDELKQQVKEMKQIMLNK